MEALERIAARAGGAADAGLRLGLDRHERDDPRPGRAPRAGPARRRGRDASRRRQAGQRRLRCPRSRGSSASLRTSIWTTRPGSSTRRTCSSASSARRHRAQQVLVGHGPRRARSRAPAPPPARPPIAPAAASRSRRSRATNSFRTCRGSAPPSVSRARLAIAAARSPPAIAEYIPSSSPGRRGPGSRRSAPRPRPLRRASPPGRAARARPAGSPRRPRPAGAARPASPRSSRPSPPSASCAAISLTVRARKAKRWQRDTIVAGILWSSVEARMNRVCGGGSSSVFRSALNASLVSMWTSSMIAMRKRSRCGA